MLSPNENMDETKTATRNICPDVEARENGTTDDDAGVVVVFVMAEGPGSIKDRWLLLLMVVPTDRDERGLGMVVLKEVKLSTKPR